MKFYEVEQVFNQYLHLANNRDFLPAVLGTIVANRLDALPVWTIFLGKASSSKSEVLGALDDSLETHVVAKITDKSLASNVNMSHKSMKGKEEPSLLAKLNGKNLIIRDATTLITIPEDKRRAIFSDLRAAFDGKFESSSGIDEKKFEAKFGCLISATDALERSRTMDAELGERFLTFRLNNEDEELVWAKISANMKLGEKKIKSELGAAAVKFLNSCPTPEEILFHPDIMTLAKAIAHGRTHVHRDRYNKQVIDVVEVSEAPFRVGKQLAAFYTGLVTVTGSSKRAMNIVRKIARDSIKPVMRARVIHSILNGLDTQKKISSHLGVPDRTISYVVGDLGRIGIIKKSPSMYDKRERTLSIKKGFSLPFKMLFG